MQVGDSFAGYVIERVLGFGGMGAVYQVRHPRLPRSDALKVLSTTLADDVEFRARFEREADLSANLWHPNIVGVLDRGEFNGQLWITMNLVGGTDAARLLAERGPLSPELCVMIATAVASALDYAHERGLLHRDVKPSNIMVEGDGPSRVLLVDFGIARPMGTASELTHTGVVLGSMSYASPEQLRGMPADGRSDQYSLACTMFHMLTGHQPFRGTTVGAVISSHLLDTPPAASSFRRLPQQVDSVFFKAMAKDPGNRFGSCSEFAAALTQAIAVGPSADTVIRGVREEPTVHRSQGLYGPTAIRPPQVPAHPQRSTRGFLIAGLVATLAIAGGIGGYALLSGFGDDGTPPTNAASSPATAPSRTGSPSEPQIVPVTQIDANGAPIASNSVKPLLPSQLPKAGCGGATIAVAGALTGDNAALGINIRNGAQLAVDQYNGVNSNCKVTLKSFDTEGDPQTATRVIPQITADQSILGLIGPAFSGEAKATGPTLAQAGLVSVTASATNPDLSKNGWPTFFRGLSSDVVQGPAVAKYLTGTLGYKKVCVIKDDSSYGIGLGKAVSEGLGARHDVSCNADVLARQRDFATVVTNVAQARPDAVFYSGYYSEAAVLVRQLRAAGITAPFVAGDGADDPQFVSTAGSAATGALLSCPCGAAKDPFTSAYTAAFGQQPGVYSVEAYDIATILISGIVQGRRTRPELLAFVRTYSGDGVGHHYQWNAGGEPSAPTITINKVS